MTPIIKTEKLTHTYGADTPFERHAIKDIDFQVFNGEFLGVIGHTGSGKSTLMQHLNGILKPTAGKVFFDGRDIWEDKHFTRQVRFKVGLVFQYPEYQLFEETVAKDIAFGPSNMGLSRTEISERVGYAAEFVGLDAALLSKSPMELSGGQKRRAAIAGIIAMQPEVLILDEPTAGLDPAGREELMEHIHEYKKQSGATVVLVTHSMDEIAKSADRVVVLNDAAIFMSGALSEIFSREKELSEIGLDVPQVTKVITRLSAMGLKVDTSAYTVGQAVEAIAALRGVKRCLRT